jgi:hypothetical protein
MVMYGSHIPYGVARKVGEIQRGILDELCSGLQSASELDWDRARKLIHEKLTPYLEVCGAHLDY